MDRLRAIWARWRRARAQRKHQHEEGQAGKIEYSGSQSPQDSAFRDSWGAGSGGSG